MSSPRVLAGDSSIDEFWAMDRPELIIKSESESARIVTLLNPLFVYILFLTYYILVAPYIMEMW